MKNPLHKGPIGSSKQITSVRALTERAIDGVEKIRGSGAGAVWVSDGERMPNGSGMTKPKLRKLLDMPLPENYQSCHSETFDPWEMLGVYGCYSADFDELAIATLEKIINKTSRGEISLAEKMFREMLCVADLCDYGTSPRTCFPNHALGSMLDELLVKWKAYAEIMWADGADDER